MRAKLTGFERVRLKRAKEIIDKANAVLVPWGYRFVFKDGRLVLQTEQPVQFFERRLEYDNDYEWDELSWVSFPVALDDDGNVIVGEENKSFVAVLGLLNLLVKLLNTTIENQTDLDTTTESWF